MTKKLKILDLLNSLKPDRPEVHICDQDALVYAVAGYRLRQTNAARPWASFIMLGGELTEVDYVIAREIREYYGRKLVSIAFQNGTLSDFRKELAAFLATDGRKYTEQLLGLLYKLPEFYYYDKAFDGLANTACSTEFSKIYDSQTAVLPGLKLLHNTRGAKIHNYWCTVADSGNLACISIDYRNPLLPVWDSIYFRKQPLRVYGRFTPSKLDGRDYHKIDAWRLIGNVSID